MMSENVGHIKKICMISDMHNMFDDRIYHKEALSLKKAGYDLIHICAGKSNQNFVSDEGIQIIQIEKKQFVRFRILNRFLKLFSGNLYKRIIDEAVKIDADVYHIHDYKLIKPAREIQKRTDAKIIFDAHDPFYQNMIDFNKGSIIKEFIYKQYSKHIQKQEQKHLPYFDLVITTEENLANYYRNKIDVPVEIIYNYTTFEIPEDNNLKEYDFIYSGKITEQRSAVHYIHAIRDVKNVKKDVKMLFLGVINDTNLLNKMKSLIEEYGLKENIEIKGKVPYNEVIDYYRKSRIGLAVFQKIPVHYIILQIKLFEYTCMGLPMIGSDFGHVKKYIEQDKTGLLVEPENTDKLAEKMIELLQNNELFDVFRTNALKHAANYTWNHMEEKLIGIYKKRGL